MMEHWGLPYYTNKAILEGIKDIYIACNFQFMVCKCSLKWQRLYNHLGVNHNYFRVLLRELDVPYANVKIH